MRRWRWWSAVLVLLAGIAAPGPAGALPARTMWNLADDFRLFPDQANPSPDRLGHDAVWSYRQVTQGGRYALLGGYTTHKFHIAGLESWWGSTVPVDEADRLPAVGINASGHTAHYSGITWPAGEVLVHPLTASAVVVAWTAPVTGNVVASGSARLAQPHCADTVGLSVLVEGHRLFRAVVRVPAPVSWSAGRLHLHRGQRLYVAIDADGSDTCDSTLLDLAVRKF